LTAEDTEVVTVPADVPTTGMLTLATELECD
jgi:hypothetical protein